MKLSLNIFVILVVLVLSSDATWRHRQRNRGRHVQRRVRRPLYRDPQRSTVNMCTQGRVFATCLMIPRELSEIRGRIEFSQQVDRACIPFGELRVQVAIQGLHNTDGIVDHGLHVHQFGDLRDGCLAAGPHYNPFNKKHGGRRTSSRHLGDFGNVREDGDGSINEIFTVPQTSIVGPRSIIGRALVLHARRDDLGQFNTEDSRTTGNSGSRLACCVIGRSDESRSAIVDMEEHEIQFE